MAYGARLESGLGVKALRGSNPLSSASDRSMTCENAGSSPPARAGAFSFPRPSLISGLIGGSILVVFGAGRPQQATYSRGYVAPDRVSHVLVPRGHRRARPTHDGHDRLLWYTQDQKHRRRRMPGVVQTSISDPCALQQGLPGVVVRRSDGCGDPASSRRLKATGTWTSRHGCPWQCWSSETATLLWSIVIVAAESVRQFRGDPFVMLLTGFALVSFAVYLLNS